MAGIQSISTENYQIAVEVRDQYFSFDPNLAEDIKYGGLAFFREKKLLGGVFFYKEHISVEFSYGINLTDPDSVLEGKGKLRRHIKLRALEDIKAKNVGFFIEQALASA